MEPDDASVVDDAVDDGGGHVAVAEHVAPSAELEVRGEDDASPFRYVKTGEREYAAKAAPSYTGAP